MRQPNSLTFARNLDAFNDIVSGGFGTPEGGLVLVWRNSSLTSLRLGYSETVRILSDRLKHCHPQNIPLVEGQLAAAEHGEGETIYDVLIEVIRTHGPGGYESGDNVHLVLS